MLIKLSSDLPIWQRPNNSKLPVYILTDMEIRRVSVKLALGLDTIPVKLVRVKSVPSHLKIVSRIKLDDFYLKLCRDGDSLYLKKV